MKRFALAALIAALPLFHALGETPAIDQVNKLGAGGVATREREVRLGDDIGVVVTHLDAYQAEANASPTATPITLYLNGVDSKLKPIAVGPISPAGDHRGELTFRLRRTGGEDLWRELLHDPFEAQRTIVASVAVSGKPALPLANRTKATLYLKKATVADFGFLWILVMLLIVGGLLYYAFTSDMLRNGAPINGTPQAFSLARSQMAWWFALIVIGYIIIWIITGDRDSIPSSLLALLGISAATALGSIMIDSADRTRAVTEVSGLLRQKTDLLAAEATLPAAGANAAADQARGAIGMRVAQMDRSVADIISPRMTKRSWLVDVLSDGDTIALHRFQILAWTLVLGLIFIATVASDLSMPEFNNTLLTLMGISSGTYLGFKFKSA